MLKEGFPLPLPLRQDAPKAPANRNTRSQVCQDGGKGQGFEV
jgi:hypothetical protein